MESGRCVESDGLHHVSTRSRESSNSQQLASKRSGSTVDWQSAKLKNDVRSRCLDHFLIISSLGMTWLVSFDTLHFQQGPSTEVTCVPSDPTGCRSWCGNLLPAKGLEYAPTSPSRSGRSDLDAIDFKV